MANLTGFEKFCGGQFWDLDVTWYTAQPDFTPCFQNTVLVWVPCAFLWLILPFYIYYFSNVHGPGNRVNKLNTSKTLIGVLLVCVSGLNLIKAGSDYGQDSENQPLASIVSPAVLTASVLLATILVQVERTKGFITSGVLFLFWLLLTIAGIVPFYSKVLQILRWTDDQDQLFFIVTFYIYYGLVLVQLVLSCIVDENPVPPDDHTKPPCPEIEASFLSRMTYWWINGLVLTGYREGIKEDNIWGLHPRDRTSTNAPLFERAWEDELQRCNWRTGKLKDDSIKQGSGYQSFNTPPKRKRTISTVKVNADEKTPLIDGPSVTMEYEDSEPKKKKQPSMARVLARVYGTALLRAHLCKLVYDLLTFVGPVLQNQLIDFTETPEEYLWKGYMFAVLFFFTGVAQSIFFHQLFHVGMTLGMRVKAAVIASVYKKALTMSNEARKDVTVGEIVNIMSVDAQRLQDVAGYLWMIWSSPLQIVIAVYMLWGIVGPSVLAGLAVMILLIPINGVLATIQRKLQIAQMKQKDQRIKLMNEVLNGMKVLKLYAWENSFQEKVDKIRNQELDTLRKYSYIGAVGTFTWTCAPFLVTLATFASYVLSGHNLDATTAFVSLSLFNILRFPINLLPMMVSYIVTASVSIGRINKFLLTGDLDSSNVQHDQSAENPIKIKRGTFAWGTSDDDLLTLRGINLTVKDGELLAVVGQVGSGKSSLISAVLGEMEKIEGSVNVRGSIAYVAQQAWIQNATLRDNILFGKPYEAKKYDEVLEACALKPDLEILPGGDQTEIGEKGINLSGGQKQRVSLARAVYANTEVYLLDDPLSAVDSHVGKHIMDKVIGPTGILKEKTRILVTHGLHWLPQCDNVAVLVGGEISEYGSYDDLLNENGALAQFIKQYLITSLEEEEEEEVDPEVAEARKEMLQRMESIGDSSVGALLRQLSATGSAQSDSDQASDGGRQRKKSRRKSTLTSPDRQMSKKVTSIDETETKLEKKEGEKLIQEEKSESGEVKLSVFFEYAKALGAKLALALMFFFMLYQLGSVASNLWLSFWTEDEVLRTAPLNSSEYLAAQDKYLGVYGALGGVQAAFVLVYAVIAAVAMVRASRILHQKMLTNILHSPMAFFDTTPTGRILNRFSRDIETIDNILPNLFRSWLNTFFTVLSTIAIISYSTPIFLSIVIPVGLLYYFVQRFYIPTSRQLKRIESTTRSPIYVNFSETITGASTIRAYGVQADFINKSDTLVDNNLIYYFSSIASNRWLGFRLEFLAASVVLCAALFAVIGKSSLSGGLVGLSISYALQVTQSLNWMVRMTSDLETNVVSVERIKEYSETEREALWDIDETKPPKKWPSDGKVSFENYETRYRAGLDLVLRGISVDIAGGEKVGIVGRTGAGKSSLTLALFRIIESSGGRIVIDGHDISGLGLHQLRSQLTILPQDPVLFSGDLRMNLDPLQQYDDNVIWRSLELAHLKDFVQSLPKQLDYECGEGGQNLSVGQRQLVCLARALLRKTNILILDEATAAVDLETDELIQATIRQEFAECTILTIAHRLNTILDSDRVIVLDTGKIAEIGPPSDLLKDKKGLFYGMAKDAGLV